MLLADAGGAVIAALNAHLGVQNALAGIAQRLLEDADLLLLLLLHVHITCTQRFQAPVLAAIIIANGIIFATQHLQVALKQLYGLILFGQLPMGLTMRRLQFVVTESDKID